MVLSKRNFSWMLILFSSFCETLSATIVKLRHNELGQVSFTEADELRLFFMEFVQDPWLLVAGIAFVLSPVCWFIALNRIQLSVGYPVLVVFHVVFIIAFSAYMLEEGFDNNKMIGFALMLVSLFCFRKEEEIISTSPE